MFEAFQDNGTSFDIIQTSFGKLQAKLYKITNFMTLNTRRIKNADKTSLFAPLRTSVYL